MSLDELLMIFAGPACALLALALFGSRRMRPRALSRWTAGIEFAMVVPTCLAAFTRSYDLVLLALVARPDLGRSDCRLLFGLYPGTGPERGLLLTVFQTSFGKR